MEWLRRSRLQRPKRNTASQSPSKYETIPEEDEEESYGITDPLIHFVNTFTLQTFTNFPLPEEDEGGITSGNVQQDLSDWQEKHAILVLSRVKELAQLRFRLCPGYMKERKFWRIYFTLVKSYAAEHQLRAIQHATLEQMSMENKNISDKNVCEVEMSEAKCSTSVLPSAT